MKKSFNFLWGSSTPDNLPTPARIEKEIAIIENTDATCLLLNLTGFLVRLELRLRMSQCEVRLTLSTHTTTPESYSQYQTYLFNSSTEYLLSAWGVLSTILYAKHTTTYKITSGKKKKKKKPFPPGPYILLRRKKTNRSMRHCVRDDHAVNKMKPWKEGGSTGETVILNMRRWHGNKGMR